MALFTAYFFELHQDQIYNVPVFMASKINKNFNFQQKTHFFYMLLRNKGIFWRIYNLIQIIHSCTIAPRLLRSSKNLGYDFATQCESLMNTSSVAPSAATATAIAIR